MPRWPKSVSELTAQAYLPAARAALRAFAIEPGALTLVKQSENITFRVQDRRDSSEYVLRLHRPGYHTLAELEAERVWIRALAAAGIAVPTPLPTHDGAEYATVWVSARAERRHAGLTRWAMGQVLDEVLPQSESVSLIEDCFGQLGGLMAALHNHASTWQPPASFSRHRLDAAGFMGAAPFWGPFWTHPALSHAQSQLLLNTRDVLHAALERHGTNPSTFSLIHADLHPGNLLRNAGGLAVIDFDDAGFGWHAYDIAVALVGYRSHPHCDLAESALLRGYRSSRELHADTLVLVPMFTLIRRLAQLGWLMQRPELGIVVARRHIEALCEDCAAFKALC